MKAALYIEGGGTGKSLQARFREGWRAFFAAAGFGAGKVRIVRGGGRGEAFRRFRTAVAGERPGTVALLLVDSEGPVRAGETAWRHLRGQNPGWQWPAGADGERVFLMVQAMETWLLADPGGLRSHFGGGFDEGAVAAWPALEEVDKEKVFEALARATASCRTRYAKGRVSFALLARIDPARVEAACPHAGALMGRLRAVAGG